MRRTIGTTLGATAGILLCAAVFAQEPGAGKLDTMRIGVDFENAALREVVEYLREATGLNFMIHPRVGDPEAPVTLHLKNVRVRSVLRVILKPLGLGAVAREGMIVILPQEEIRPANVTRVYDVRDLFVKIRHFPGPRLELLPGRGSGRVPGPIVRWPEEAREPVDEMTLEDIVRTVTGGAAWDENDEARIRFTPDRRLVVTQTPDVHRKIERAIRRLRWFR